jgi:hypothetical protein
MSDALLQQKRLRASVSLFNGVEAQFKFFSSYVFYYGASKALILGIVRGENPPVYFNLKCASSVREENHSCPKLRCVNIISSLHKGFFLPLAISFFRNDKEADLPAASQQFYLFVARYLRPKNASTFQVLLAV